MSKKRRLFYALFTAAVLLCLFLCFLKAVLMPADIVEYENRGAVKLPAYTAGGYYDASFQGGFESALSDQIPLASKLKKLYNIIDSYTARPLVKKLLAGSDGYIYYRNVAFYGDRIVSAEQYTENLKYYIDRTAENINRYASLSPQAEFYVYYVETDSDVDLSTGRKAGIYEELSSCLELPEENVSGLEFSDFSRYDTMFLRTDHHWNHLGSRQAYVDVCAMLGVSPLEPVGLHTEYAAYHGTRAAGIEAFPMEDFSVYDYDYPEMSFYAGGGEIPDYGLQKVFISGGLESFSYGSVFGGDYDELIIDTGKSGGSILIIGDSYDNPILKCFASSFSKTYSIDMRGFCPDGLSSFDLPEYIKANDIDTVLFIGGGALFINTLNGRS